MRYIHFRLEAVGAQSPIFNPEACDVIAHAARGIPRTINILCDTALVYAYAVEAHEITPNIVNLVIENKQEYGVLPLSELQSPGY